MNTFAKFKSRGFTLIEVLVAVLILGLGLLGMLSIIINSLKLSSSSTYRTVAGQQAYAIAEVLRANPSLLATAASTTQTTINNPTATITSACLTVGSTCTRSEYVGTEFAMWQTQLASVLPSGWGTICRDPNSPPTPPDTTAATATTAPTWSGCGTSGPYVIKICWNESRVAASKGQASSAGFLCTWTSL